MNMDLLTEAISDLKNGSAICLIGAGFSSQATDKYGNSVPTTKELEREICDLISIPTDEGGSLSD